MIQTKDYDFQDTLDLNGLDIGPMSIETLWVNITRLCNQECRHCHVDASPRRNEQMELSTIEKCLKIMAENSFCRTLDITGGAPELNPHFDYFVTQARSLGKRVVLRHNLTVTVDGNPQTGESKQYLPAFFAEKQVEILASLPHYDSKIVEEIRGHGVFKKSIESIRQLNSLGYGKSGSGLLLNLVYNHDGPVSPAEKDAIETVFREKLWNGWGLEFNRLFAVTNVPVNRFSSLLQQSGEYDNYMRKLVNAFSLAAAEGVVCRSLISVGYDGKVYDCDFNQMMGMQIYAERPVTIFNLDFDALMNRRIQFGSHCFGCTAGGGSS